MNIETIDRADLVKQVEDCMERAGRECLYDASNNHTVLKWITKRLFEEFEIKRKVQ